MISLKEVVTNKRNKKGNSAVAKVTAQTGTKEISRREINPGFSTESLDLGDQSPLGPATGSWMVRNRRGRPRKEGVRDNTLSIEQVIHEARAELRGYLVKTKEIVLRVGQALEIAGIKPSKICRKIKRAFAEEIREDLIHPRTIENYCLDKWKIETKPRGKGQKNAKRSFSESEATLPTEMTEEASSQTSPQKDARVQQVFMITDEKFATVRQVIDQAIDRCKKKCYFGVNENDELDWIKADAPRVVEATTGE